MCIRKEIFLFNVNLVKIIIKKLNLLKKLLEVEKINHLSGVPPYYAIKLVDLNPDQSIATIRRIVQKEYRLNPILAIQFIFKGKVLPDTLKLSKIGIHPMRDLITIISTHGGGGIL